MLICKTKFSDQTVSCSARDVQYLPHGQSEENCPVHSPSRGQGPVHTAETQVPGPGIDRLDFRKQTEVAMV